MQRKIRKKGTHVPVKMTSPGISVDPRLKNDTACATLKIISAVELSCTVSPLTLVLMPSFCGSGSSAVLTMPGPNGAHPSNPLPSDHCPPPSLSCQSRCEKSLPTA